MADKRLDTLKVAGIGVAGLLAFALVGYLLWKLVQSLGKGVEGIGDGLAGIGKGLGGIGQGVGTAGVNIGEGIGSASYVAPAVGGGIMEAFGGSNLNKQAARVDPEKKPMRLEILDKRDSQPGINKRTRFTAKVTDAAGQPVQGATVKSGGYGSGTLSLTIPRSKVTGPDGLAFWDYSTIDQPGTSTEDDADFQAFHTLHNPSNVVRVK